MMGAGDLCSVPSRRSELEGVQLPWRIEEVVRVVLDAHGMARREDLRGRGNRRQWHVHGVAIGHPPAVGERTHALHARPD
eukprot:CAMPEP_0176288792 /NCGR_PEP_ID=MMETSP0121_2-20121125/54159_1 /TAXON_ID=160619 /ORGANISM="Kryptoperidinium foliaceum, Strain CCMP 1326" /LENGTH=79 /DNA_ID=CAMNT_0017629501 /DNA_START=33 /DNA_END=269 /DNA_ORIENTATION=+